MAENKKVKNVILVPGFLTLCRVGEVLGVLPITYKPREMHSAEGPFKTVPFLYYSFFAWILYNSVWIYFSSYYLETNSYFSPVAHLIIEMNLTFLLYTFASNKLLPQALNRIVKLTRRIRRLDLELPGLLYPCIPAVIILLKIFVDYESISATPPFHVLSIIGLLIKSTVDGLLYTSLLCVEKIINRINRQIKNNDLNLSLRQLQPLMIYFFDVQEFLFFISKTVGLAFLVLIVNTMMANVFYMSTCMPNLIMSIRHFNMDTIRKIVHLTEWQFRVYTFLLICYRSQRINEAVQALKWTLGDIQAKNLLQKEVMDAVYLFEKRLHIKSSFFSAAGIVQFNFPLVLTILNKVLTYLFAISTLDEDNS